MYKEFSIALPAVVFGLVGIVGVSEVSASTLTLVTMSSFTSSEAGVNSDGNPFLLDGDTIVVDELSSIDSAARLDASITYEVPEPGFGEASATGYASVFDGAIGNATNAGFNQVDGALSTRSSGLLEYVFRYDGAEDLVLSDGWLSFVVEGTWGLKGFGSSVSSNASVSARTSTDAIFAQSNFIDRTFLGSPGASLIGADGSTAEADSEGFFAEMLVEGLTLTNGEFLTLNFGHNVSSGSTSGSAMVDALNTASLSLNVLGLTDVDTSFLGSDPVAWLANAPVAPSSVPLPAAAWMLIAALGSLALTKRKSNFG